MSRIASNVRRLRAAGRWTQEEVAARAGGLSPRLYRQIEAGTTNLTAATLTRIAEALEADVADLLTPADAVRPKRRRLRKTLGVEGPGQPASPTSSPRSNPSPSEQKREPIVPSGPHATAPLGDEFPLSARIPSALVGSAGTVRPSSEAGAVAQDDAFTEATSLARRVAELRRELEDRRRQLLEEALRVESALVNLADTPGRSPTSTAARVTTAVVVTPPLPVEHGVRGAVAVLLRANPAGLRTTELAEAIRSSSMRPRKNELHNTVRSMFDAGILTRGGFRGGFVYRLRVEQEGGPES